MMIMFVYMFMASMLSFALNRKHLLTMLLSMELVILSLFMIMFMFFINMNFEFYFTLIFLTMSVCESGMGLALMVSMIRCYGNDYFSSLNLLW
uniref:NADH-ubiquinone oxidoreductase chain 4L n=1 Tax=Coccinella septempunctata TaxID=41139 RepID=I6NWD3_COCSE|nr:NADH dehydrogenase subunit 4L [Coccinella septempunctata]UXW88387.1 NADH dehydrogenase subunit 4L [Coccinella septempunctata]